jgi:hypothetical protein
MSSKNAVNVRRRFIKRRYDIERSRDCKGAAALPRFRS